MDEISFISQVSLYVLLALIFFFTILLVWFQVHVLMGRSMQNPDGSFDDWHRQRIHFGIAFADLFVTFPTSIAAIALILQSSPWGQYMLTMVGFFYVWANTMTTATSLRFEKPRLTLMWFIVFPMGIFVGLGILVWVAFNAGLI